MKKISLLITVIMMLALFASCGTKGGTTTTGASGATGTSGAAASSNDSTTAAPAASEKLNVTVPAGWVKNEASVLEHQYAKNTASFMVKKENYTQKTLSGVVTEAEGIFKNSFDEYKAVGTEDIKIAGRDAKKLTFTCKMSKLSMKYMYVFIFVNNEANVITFGDQTSTFDSLSSDFETILDGLTIS